MEGARRPDGRPCDFASFWAGTSLVIEGVFHGRQPPSSKRVPPRPCVVISQTYVTASRADDAS